MDRGGLLPEELHYFIILGPIFSVVGGVTVPQDVVRHALGYASGFRERQDGRPEIARVGLENTSEA